MIALDGLLHTVDAGHQDAGRERGDLFAAPIPKTLDALAGRASCWSVITSMSTSSWANARMSCGLRRCAVGQVEVVVEVDRTGPSPGMSVRIRRRREPCTEHLNGRPAKRESWPGLRNGSTVHVLGLGATIHYITGHNSFFLPKRRVRVPPTLIQNSPSGKTFPYDDNGYYSPFPPAQNGQHSWSGRKDQNPVRFQRENAWGSVDVGYS